MHKNLVLALMIISVTTLALTGCTQSNANNKHHDLFNPIEVENNNNYTVEDNTESNSTDTENSDATKDTTSTPDSSEESIEFVQPDVDFAKQYADVVLNAIDTVISYDENESVIKVVDTGDTINNELVLNVVNQAALNSDYTTYELVHTEETDTQDIYVVRLDYDYWIIFYDKNGNSASGYHDGTGTLATMFGDKGEDIEYEDWD